MSAPRKRYAVMLERGYVSHPAGGTGLAWTESRAEAEDLARDMEGTVVDADDFAARWHEYARAGKVET